MKKVRANKREAAHNLHMAVLAQQRAQSAFASAANAKIDKANKHVAANAAQIKANAKKARDDLMHATNKWQKKIDNFKAESKKGQSKIAAQWSAMNKKTRQIANNKVQKLVASTAARFADVRKKMADNRAHVDMAVKHATQRLNGVLLAQKALGDKRYAQSVADIAKARAEANAQLAAAKTEFKLSALHLMDSAKRQIAKVENRITGLSGVVKSNHQEQLRVNRKVNGELKHMVDLGNRREKKLLANHKRLARISFMHMQANKRRMKLMSARFQARVDKVRKDMAADRAHQDRELKKATAKLYASLASQQEKMD